MELNEYRSRVFKALTIVDSYVAKSKRKEITEGMPPSEAKDAWADYVAGYAGLLGLAKVHPDDIEPSALEHLKRSKYFPTPHELIEIAKPMGYVRAMAEQARLLALPQPAGEPLSDEKRQEILDRLEEAACKLTGHPMRTKPREFSGESYEVSPERLASIEAAKLRIEQGGAA